MRSKVFPLPQHVGECRKWFWYTLCEVKELLEINAFYMVPKCLFEPKYSGLSRGAKLMYGLLIERYNLSLKNNWKDTDGEIYLYYPVKVLAETLNISEKTTIKDLKELEAFDLVKRVKQGMGKPDKIKLYISSNESILPSTTKRTRQDYNGMVTYDINDLEKLINR